MNQIERIVLAMKEGNWNIQIPLHTSGQKKAPYPRWLSGFDPLAYIPVRRDQYSAVTCGLCLVRTFMKLTFTHQCPTPPS